MASPLLQRQRTREIAASTSLWRNAPEEVTRPRPSRVVSTSSNHAPETEGDLSAQLAELRAKVARQEELLRRIVDAVEGRSLQKRAMDSQEGSRSR